MARFVLVHGAFSGAWIWGPLQERLKAPGHSVDVFDLPGLGDDQTPRARSRWMPALTSLRGPGCQFRGGFRSRQQHGRHHRDTGSGTLS